MSETEARHYLREVLTAAVHRADEGCADWRIADALLDAGEITWNYQIRPEPQVATFQLIFTATDAEPASGGVVEPSCERHPRRWFNASSPTTGLGPCDGNPATCPCRPGPLTAEEATPDCVSLDDLADDGLFEMNALTFPTGELDSEQYQREVLGMWPPDPCDRTDLPEASDMRCAGCGAEAGQHPAWRKRHRRQHDPGALIEEPDLYEQGEGA